MSEALAAPAPRTSVSLKNDHPSVGDRVKLVFRITSPTAIERVANAELDAPSNIDVMGPTMRTRGTEVFLEWWVTATNGGVYELTPSAVVDGVAVRGATSRSPRAGRRSSRAPLATWI